MFAKVRPDTYNEWLRRVRSGRCDFGLSNVRLCRLWSGFRLRVFPDTHALEMAIPTSVYIVYGLPMKTTYISSLGQLGTSWILRAMHVRGALQLETPASHIYRRAANLGWRNARTA